ncbi:MAG: poly-gamma-glutamate biosynthesis protein PgsC [Planctomycetaceae bacterium]|nr:poly-gamma-glutamate biosynthesis protein PgsC [Planctomycetaceae bacterium]
MDTLTVSIAIGLIVSLLFTEMFGLSAGGMIVPGYLALQLHQPITVLVTLLTACLTFAIVRLFSRYAIVYGRRRIVMMILVGFLVGSATRMLPPLVGDSLGSSGWVSDCFCVIGFIIPGLIALWMDRQGWVETLSPLLTSSIVVRLVLILLGMEIMV